MAVSLTAEFANVLVQLASSNYRWLGCNCRMPNAPDASIAEPLILIVENDLSTRVMYREFLSRCGFRIMDAHNGHQAMAKVREMPPDAVVTDLNVPGLDGFELCRALQESAATRTIPILAVTGHSQYLDQPDRFRQAGISHVLTKPCAPGAIAHELRRLLAAAGVSR
jgi:CheY-like chemotaxis protein